MNVNDKVTLQNTLNIAQNALQQMEKQDKICQNISNRLKQAKQELSSSGMTGYGTAAIFIIIFSSLFFIIPTIFCLLLLIIQIIAAIAMGEIGALPQSLPSLIIPMILHIIPTIISIIAVVFLFKKNNSVKIEKKEKLKSQIQKYEYDLQINTDILNKVIEDNYEALCSVPEKYRYIHAISAMLDYLNTMRAETLKEAINLYEEEMHRMRMEMSQQQLLAIQNEQQRTLNSINSYTKTNTVLSVINTVNTLTSD